jgi:hypothetical protein
MGTRPPKIRVLIGNFRDNQSARHEAWAPGTDGFVAKAGFGRKLLPLILRLVCRERQDVDVNPTEPPRFPVERPRVSPGVESESRQTGAAFAAPIRVLWDVLRRGFARQRKEGRSMKGTLKIAGLLGIVAAVAVTTVLAGGPAKPTFIALDQTYMVPQSISADGSKIAGTAYFGSPAFYWTASEGVVLIGGGCGAGTATVSGDGSTIVNCIIDENGYQVAAKWLGGTDWLSLGSVEGAVPCDRDLSSSWGIDYTGQTAVGLVWLAQLCRAHAGSWDLVNGGPATDLGSLVDGRSSRANAISGDGQTIVGWQDGEFGSRQGAKWVGGVESWVLTPAGEYVGEVAYVNYDGTVMAGSNLPYGTNNAWVYTPKKGFQTIAAPNPVIWAQTAASAASDDGSLVGGLCRDQNGNPKGWIWSAKGEKFTWMADYLAKNRLAAGWTIGAVSAISADGSTLAGLGIDPDGIVRGWVLQNYK